MPDSDDTNLDIQIFGKVIVVEVKTRMGLDDPLIHLIGMDFRSYMQQHGCKKLMLDFRSIERLSSAGLGKLVVLRKKVQPSGVSLCLCHVSAQLLEELAVPGFDKLFKIEAHPGDDSVGVAARIKPPLPWLDGVVSMKQPPSDEDA